MKDVTRQVLLLIVFALIIGSIYYLESSKTKRFSSPSVVNGVGVSVINSSLIGAINSSDAGVAARIKEKSGKFKMAREIMMPYGFVNTDNISISSLIGKKVVLVDFWTYSCINCERTIPYLNSWYAKYKDMGFEIVGVHSPEFNFEQKYDNVVRAVEKFGIKYPVVLDNGFATWTAYDNHYWPHKYLIDIDGFIVYDHIGEGGYEETEKEIQDLLAERMAVLKENMSVPVNISTPSGVVDVNFFKVRSPEVYFGAARNDYLVNGVPSVTGFQSLSVPDNVVKNGLYLSGKWNFSDEFAENLDSAGIVFEYDAKNVYFVASADNDTVIRISVDGKDLVSDAGADVRDSSAVIKDEGLYQLVNGSDYGVHTLRIHVDKPGLKAFTFTFG